MKELSFNAIFGDVVGYLEGLKGAEGVVGAEDAIRHICACIRDVRENMEKRYADINKYVKSNFMKSVDGEIALYFARQENRLFILSLANELFCIEKYNRMIAGVESV